MSFVWILYICWNLNGISCNFINTYSSQEACYCQGIQLVEDINENSIEGLGPVFCYGSRAQNT